MKFAVAITYFPPASPRASAPPQSKSGTRYFPHLVNTYAAAMADLTDPNGKRPEVFAKINSTGEAPAVRGPPPNDPSNLLCINAAVLLLVAVKARCLTHMPMHCLPPCAEAQVAFLQWWSREVKELDVDDMRSDKPGVSAYAQAVVNRANQDNPGHGLKVGHVTWARHVATMPHAAQALLAQIRQKQVKSLCSTA